MRNQDDRQSMASMSRFETEKLTEKIDITLWKARMEALLFQQGVEQALLGDDGFTKGFDEAEKKRIIGKAKSTLIMSLVDKALREVIKLKTAKEVWDKLEVLYHVKAVASKIKLKQMFFNYKMKPDKSIIEHLDDFNKL